MQDLIFYIVMPFVAFGVPLLMYLVISYANRKFKQMDQELERNSEAASLTTTELKAMLHEAIAESMATLLDRVEQNEQRLEALEQRLEHRSLPGALPVEIEADLDEADPSDRVPSRKRTRI